jgi:transposase
MNYIPLIVHCDFLSVKKSQKRRIKDPSKLIILNADEKEIYKKRMVIERTFNRLKMNRKICLRYVRNFISVIKFLTKIENFIGFVYLALIKLLC